MNHLVNCPEQDMGSWETLSTLKAMSNLHSLRSEVLGRYRLDQKQPTLAYHPVGASLLCSLA